MVINKQKKQLNGNMTDSGDSERLISLTNAVPLFSLNIATKRKHRFVLKIVLE